MCEWIPIITVVYINIERRREKTKGCRREKRTQHHAETGKQIIISMDRRLRCFGAIPKTHNFLLSLSVLLFIFFGFTNAAFDLATIPFNDGYSPLFGDGNVVRSDDGNGVRLLLDRFTGKFTYMIIFSCVKIYVQKFYVCFVFCGYFMFLCFFNFNFCVMNIQVRVSSRPICTSMDSSARISSCHRIILLAYAWPFM